MSSRSKKTIYVCKNCLTASCWYGEFMCDEAQISGIVRMEIAQLRRLKREHPDNWSVDKLVKIYGTPTP